MTTFRIKFSVILSNGGGSKDLYEDLEFQNHEGIHTDSDMIQWLDDNDKSEWMNENNVESIINYEVVESGVELDLKPKIKIPIKTILMENMGLLKDSTAKWADSIDDQYKELNPEPRDYSRSDDLHWFGTLINPDLENILTDSGFPTNMPYEAGVSFGKFEPGEWEEDKFLQVEYFMWLLREAVLWRSRHGLKPLTLHVNYIEPNTLVESINKGKLGEDTKTYLKLTLRQCSGHLILKEYKDHKLIKTYLTEDDLNFN